MKIKIISFIVLIFPFVPSLAQTCSEQDVLKIKTKWEFRKDSYLKTGPSGITAAQAELIFHNTNAYRKLFLESYPEPFGGQTKGNGTVVEPSVFDIKGHRAYHYEVSYFGFHCSKNKDGVVTNMDYLSPSSAQVQANDLRGVLEDEAGEFILNGKPVQLFRLAHRIGSIGKYPLFEGFGFENKHSILIVHRNMLPYRYITRKELLESLRYEYQKQLKEELANADEGENQILKTIEDTKKNFSGEIRDNMLKELNSQLDQYRKRKKTNKQKLSSGVTEELDSINHYLATASKKDLDQPAIVKDASVFRGFVNEQEGGYYMVILNYSYFRKDLPDYAAQTLVLNLFHWRTDPGAVLFRQTIETRFPYDKLYALLDR